MKKHNKRSLLILLSIKKFIWIFAVICVIFWNIEIWTNNHITQDLYKLIKSPIFIKVRLTLYSLWFIYIIWKYYHIKNTDFKIWYSNNQIFHTCIRYIAMNKKIFLFSTLLLFQIIILDFFVSNYFYSIKDIWPLIALLLSPFATSMYIIANNVWHQDKSRDIVSENYVNKVKSLNNEDIIEQKKFFPV